MGTEKDFRVKKGLVVENGDVTLTSGNIELASGYADIDNIRIDGNTVSSQDTDGNIDLTPNGTGEVNITKVDIAAGAIDGTTVGAASASTGAFTTLTASGATTLNGDVTLGNATGDSITNTGRWLGDFVPEVDSSIDLGTSSLQFAEAHIDAGYIDAITVSGTSTLATVTASGTVTVGTDASGADVTFHSATSGDYMLWDTSAKQLKIVGTASSVALDVDTGDFTVGAYGLTNAGVATIASMAGNWTNAGRTVADAGTLTTVDINGGTIDGATIATSNVTVGADKTLTVSAGTLSTSAAQKLAIVQGVGANTDIGSYSFTAQTLVSDVGTGTAPLTVSSTTNVANLNASSLGGATFAAPGAIGGTTAAAGTFAALVGTSLDVSGGNITNVGQISLDSIGDDDSNDMQIKISNSSATALDIIQGSDSYMKFDTNAAGIIVSVPLFTIGDGTAEDTKIIFDGNEVDFRMGIDDSANEFEIGPGAAHDTTPAIVIDGNGHVTKIGQDTHGSGEFLKWDGSKAVWASTSGAASSLAADDLTVGDAAVTLTTSTGNITIDAAANNSDIIFKGTDATADITMLTLDGSDAGAAIFNADVTIGDDLTLLSDASVLGFGTNTDVTLTHVHDTGLLLNGAMELQFRDSGLTIASSTDGQLDIDADAELEIVAPRLDVDSTSEITFTTPALSIDSGTTTKPLVVIKNSTNDATGSELRFVMDRGAATAAVNDVAGAITFYTDDASENNQAFGKIQTKATAVTSDSEAGEIAFSVATTAEGSLAEVMLITGGAAAATSTVDIKGHLTVRGTTTTVNSTTLEVADININLGNGVGNDAAVDGGGITLESSSSNKTFNWVDATDAWTSNQHMDLASGKAFKIAGTSVLNATTLGSAVVSSSLTSVGALNSGSITSGFTSIDTGSGAISTTGTLTGGALVGTSLAVSGTITGDTSLTLDSTTLVTAELGVLDGITTAGGTVTASKALVVDGSRDLATIRNLTSDGTVQGATLSADAVAIIDTGRGSGTTITGATSLMNIAKATYRAAKVLYHIKKDDSVDTDAGEILITYNGTNAFLTHYAEVSTGSAVIGTWDATVSGANIEVRFTPTANGAHTYSLCTTQLIT